MESKASWGERFPQLLDCHNQSRQHLIDEEEVEAKSEGQDKDGDNDGEACHSLDHIFKHEDEDAEEPDEAELTEEVQPGRCDDDRSKGPLPALRRIQIVKF